jgi:tetratricopeptide (TPR) repeat protein
VDALKNGLSLKPERRSLLRSPLRATPSAPSAGEAHDHGEEAYNDPHGRAAVLPFGLAAVAILVWWAAEEGGYAPTAWYPGALLFLALLAIVAASPGRRASLTSRGSPAIVLLAAFTAWTFLSIAWAGVQGDAWDGANRTLLYFIVYATFALLRWRAPEGALVLGLFALGIAAIGGFTLASDGAEAFNGNRLAAPIGYENASAALFLMAFWPAVALAARPEIHWAARSLLGAAGGLLLQLALLAQSRGSVVAGVIALLVLVLVSQERLRVLAVLLLIAVATLATLDPLLDLVTAGTEAEVGRAVAHERAAVMLSTGALLLIGALVFFLDQPGRARRGLALVVSRGRVAAVVTAGLVLVGVATAAGVSTVAEAPRPGLESGRYDMWRVAAGEFADHPLLGVGVDNFAVDFARERRTGEEPLYPHSLLLRSFSQTGLIGGALFLGFVAAALAAALPRRRDSDPLSNAVAAASVASGVYWLLHGSIDWLWEIPVLGATALALLGLASGLARPTPFRTVRNGARSAAALLGAGALFIAAVGSFALPGLAAFELERAVRAWPDSPERAFSLLERARRVNPLSERADVVAGALAQRGRQADLARRAFRRALERNPDDWYAHLQLALLDAADGRRVEALTHLERARSLNPQESVVLRAEENLSAHAPDPAVAAALARLAVRGPLGRRPVECGPVLGLANRCRFGRGGK